jgi:hypothetical protein
MTREGGGEVLRCAKCSGALRPLRSQDGEPPSSHVHPKQPVGATQGGFCSRRRTDRPTPSNSRTRKASADCARWPPRSRDTPLRASLASQTEKPSWTATHSPTQTPTRPHLLQHKRLKAPKTVPAIALAHPIDSRFTKSVSRPPFSIETTMITV